MKALARGWSALLCLSLLASCAAVPQPAAPPAARPAPPVEYDRSRAGFSFQGRFAQGGVVLGQAPSGTVRLTLDGDPVDFDRDGRFLIGFGRDHAEHAVLRAELPGGDIVVSGLKIARTEWRVESLPNLPRGTKPTPEFLRIRAIELERIGAARRFRANSDGWRQTFIWPATGRISGVFGSQRIYAGEPGAPHSGVDVARPTGTPIVAPADGVVILAADRPFTLEGNLLMIGHGMGLNSAFLHLSRIDVKEGDRVRQGQVIGAIGATGRATGPHLHWGMKWRDERIDPQPLAGAMPGG